LAVLIGHKSSPLDHSAIRPLQCDLKKISYICPNLFSANWKPFLLTC